VAPWLALLLALPLVVGPARAEEPAPVHRAEEIVVEGERDQPPLAPFEDTPVEREVLDKEDLDRRPGTDAADVLRTLPGVRQQQRIQGEEAAVSIEGLPPEYTRALVDGQRYAGEIGAVHDFGRLPLAGAEQVEVLRGTQALRYGAQAAGSIVRIDTADPPEDGLRVRAEGGGGNDGWRYGAGSAGFGGPKAGGWLRVVSDEIDGFDPPDDVDEEDVLVSAGSQSERLARDVLGKLRFQLAETLELTTRAGWRLDEETGLNDDGSGTREETRWLAGGELVWEPGPTTSVEASLDWFDTDFETDAARDFQLAEDELAARVALDHLFMTGSWAHEVSVGVDAFRQSLDLAEDLPTFEIQDPLLGNGAAQDTFHLGGPFAILHSEPTSWLALEGGLRVQLHDEFGSKVLPQVALLWTPWRRGEGRFLRVRASWGRGWRTPSLRDLNQPPAAQLGGAYFLAGNPDLIPEDSRSLRLGLEWVPTEWGAVSVTAFRNDIDDFIRSTAAGSIRTGTELVPPSPLSPEQQARCERFGNALPQCDRSPREVPVDATLFRRTNLDTVNTQGLESRIRVRPHSLLTLQVAHTWLDTEVEDSNIDIQELPNEPEHVVDVTAELTVPSLETRITALGRWRGRALRETSGTGLASFTSQERSDPSFVLDLRVAQPLGEHVELYSDFFNLTDERVVGSNVVRGRQWFVGLRVRFD